MPIFDIIRSDHYRSEAEIQVEGHDSLVSYSAKAVIDDIVNERQQHFELPPFVHFWRKSWTDESERPLIENRYSPYRPTAAGRATRGSMAGIRLEQSLDAPTH